MNEYKIRVNSKSPDSEHEVMATVNALRMEGAVKSVPELVKEVIKNVDSSTKIEVEIVLKDY